MSGTCELSDGVSSGNSQQRLIHLESVYSWWLVSKLTDGAGPDLTESPMSRDHGAARGSGRSAPRPGERYESGGIMITVHACPRCHGAVLEYGAPATDSALCVNCGWRQPNIPPDIQAQVEAHLGEPFLRSDRTGSHRVGTGKPPLSGWDRVKRRKAREAAHSVETARRLTRTGRKLVGDSSIVA